MPSVGDAPAVGEGRADDLERQLEVAAASLATIHVRDSENPGAPAWAGCLWNPYPWGPPACRRVGPAPAVGPTALRSRSGALGRLGLLASWADRYSGRCTLMT